MRIDVLTLFPEMITSYCGQSILGIAQDNGVIDIRAHNPRDYTNDKHKCVDDVPYGGGAGMLLSPQPFFDCFKDLAESFQQDSGKELAGSNLKSLQELDLSELDRGTISHPQDRNYEVLTMAPSGRPFDRHLAKELSIKKNLIIICGRYEGLDERIKDISTLEVSVGDYVLTGGELAALNIIDASTRLIDGVLGDDNSSLQESFEPKNYIEILQDLNVTKKEFAEFFERVSKAINKKIQNKKDLEDMVLLEYPQYTRPADFRGNKVPGVLQSGDHKKIMLWRLEEAIKSTYNKRSDLI